ncbi:MAG: hypothetical protein O9284_16290 [Steroidobacteraceae bacterium]|nr:hypothetical protein [Steroidobacteraceae bacterium]
MSTSRPSSAKAALLPAASTALRRVDDHRVVRGDEHVELGQVAVDEPEAEHADDVAGQHGVMLAGRLRGEFHLAEPRGRVAVRIRHQFHDQHAVEAAEPLRHAHAGRLHPVERVHLRVLPGGLVFTLAEGRALAHRAGLAAAAHAPAFLVTRRRLQ